MSEPLACCDLVVHKSCRFKDEGEFEKLDLVVRKPRICVSTTETLDCRGCVPESVQAVSDNGGNDDDVIEEIYSSTRITDDEDRIVLRKTYMIKELEVEGYTVQSLEIGGHTRDFEVQPRNPLHRMGQRVHCLCLHVKKVRSECFGLYSYWRLSI